MAVAPRAARVDVTDGIATVTLDRAEKRNPFSLATMRELTAALAAIGDDPAVRVAIVRAAGPAFSAGHDLREMLEREIADYREIFAACTAMMTTIQRIPQPVIAEIAGIATAAGCQFVASCDLAIAGDDARFATPGVKIGLFCTTPMIALTRAIGRKRAMEMLLTGAFVDAPTAAAWGLINRVVPNADLAAATRALALTIAAAPAAVIGDGKSAFYAQIDLPQSDAYALAEREMSAHAGSANAQEGMRAFLERRAPDWP